MVILVRMTTRRGGDGEALLRVRAIIGLIRTVLVKAMLRSLEIQNFKGI